jgi:hypothetical protein
MRIALATYHPYLEAALEAADAPASTDPLLTPLVELRTRLHAAGDALLTRRQLPLDQADAAVFVDLDMPLFQAALALPATVPCLLICQDSPLRVLWSHNAQTLFNKRWAAILTWNRSFEAEHIQYYDIPFFAPEPAAAPDSTPRRHQGVSISTRHEFTRGQSDRRDHFYAALAKHGALAVFGPGWSPQPPATPLERSALLSRYAYAVVVEDAQYPGYVTSALAESIWAETPALYFGDAPTAARRFPGATIPLPELSLPAFTAAHAALEANYAQLCENTRGCRATAATWPESFFATVLTALQRLRKG